LWPRDGEEPTVPGGADFGEQRGKKRKEGGRGRKSAKAIDWWAGYLVMAGHGAALPVHGGRPRSRGRRGRANGGEHGGVEGRVNASWCFSTSSGRGVGARGSGNRRLQRRGSRMEATSRRASPMETFYRTRGGRRYGRRGMHFWARYGPNWILGPKAKL
jgi:hypothetical protein